MRRRIPLCVAILVVSCGDDVLDVGHDSPSRYATPETVRAEADAGPGVATVIASRQINASSILVDEKRVYWAHEGLGNPQGAREEYRERGIVRSCEPDDCAHTVVTHAEKQRVSDLIAVVGGKIYWTGQNEAGAEGIFACAVEGCGEIPELVVPTSSSSNVETDGSEIFWMNDGASIFRCSLADCASTLVLFAKVQSWGAGPQSSQIALSATNVYWVDGRYTRSIMTLPKDGSAEPRVLVTDLHSPDRLVITTTRLFWLEYFSLGAISSCALPDCASGPTILASPVSYAQFLAADERGFHWFDRRGRPPGLGSDDGPADLFECGIEGCGGELPSAIATDLQWPIETAINRSHVYWLSRGESLGDEPSFGPYAGTIKRIRRSK